MAETLPGFHQPTITPKRIYGRLAVREFWIMKRQLITRQQDELLYTLVKAARSLKLSEPAEFLLVDNEIDNAEPLIIHPCLPAGEITASRGDVETLIRKGLLRESAESRKGLIFNIDPRGFEIYRQNPKSDHRPIPGMGISARAYMDGSAFEQNYPIAYDKWAQAEALLPGVDPTPTGLTIQQLCHEALIAYAGYLESEADLGENRQVDAPADERISIALKSDKFDLAEADRSYISALLKNWRKLLARVRKRGENDRAEVGVLHWQDLHLAVFHTAVVMFEIDRSLSRSS